MIYSETATVRIVLLASECRRKVPANELYDLQVVVGILQVEVSSRQLMLGERALCQLLPICSKLKTCSTRIEKHIQTHNKEVKRKEKNVLAQ